MRFNIKQALLNYQDRPEFNDTITRAKACIEEYAERRLFDKEGVQGTKFSLINNFKGRAEKPKDDFHKELLEKLDDILEGLNMTFKGFLE